MEKFNIDEILKIWGGRESWKVEYKESREKLSRDIWETVSSFANTEGGVILLGYKKVKNKYIPVGVKNPSQILDDFTSNLSQKFNFCPVVQAFIIQDQGKDVIVIEVKEAMPYQKPIYIKDAGPLKGGFKRVGATDIRLSDEDIHRFYIERSGAPDAQILKGTGLKDIDISSLDVFRRLRELHEPGASELHYNDEELLRAYNLISPGTGELTCAGVLLFGKEKVVRRYFPAFRVDVIRIKGIKWGKEQDPFLSRDFYGNLLNIRPLILDFIERFFAIPFRADKRGDRINDSPDLKMMRETLTNLLMHQNYFHTSPSQVRIYNNRIEFYNPGHSLKDPAKFSMPGSALRNPLIASVFYDIGWAETKGTGLKTALEELEREGYPQPEFINDVAYDTFTVIIPYPSDIVTKSTGDQVSDQVSDHVGMMDVVAKILAYCETPKSLKEIMEFLGFRHKTYFRRKILGPLIKAGLIERTIPDKPRSRFQKYVTVKKTRWNGG